MYAKVKDGVIVTFPYGYDQLQDDNPDKHFIGNIVIRDIFNESEAAEQGYELVGVEFPIKPNVTDFEVAELANKPVFEDGRWVINWVTTNKSDIPDVIDF